MVWSTSLMLVLPLQAIVCQAMQKQFDMSMSVCVNCIVYQIGCRAHRDLQVLLSEVAPWKLDMMTNIDAWIQIACPRLSIDWGEGFHKPTLTPYEVTGSNQTVMSL